MMLGFPPLPTEEEMQRSYEAGMRSKRKFDECRGLADKSALNKTTPGTNEWALEQRERSELARLKATSSVSV